MNARFPWASAVLLAALAGPLPALAQYPDKPLKMIVPWPPGGVTDTLARFTADQLQRNLGQTVVVDNKGGANGIIGSQAAKAMAPDGYGFLAVTAETHAINPSVYKPMSYDPVRDFDAIAMVARVSFVLATRADLPPNNVQEMVAYAKANPGKVSAASYGIGSTSHLGLATFEKLTGTDYTHVPFQGVSPAVNALIGGQVDLAFVNAYNVEQHRKAGKVKILGVAGPQRLHTIPDVPTMAEQGIEGLHAGNWYGFVTPRGVPEAARQKLAAELQKVGQSAAFREKAHAMGVEVEFRDAARFAEFMKSEGARLGEVVRDKGIELKR
jgi:tripartite-type tricarboxylate transporter receptor subunit TctC